jgi:hypothetical protein
MMMVRMGGPAGELRREFAGWGGAGRDLGGPGIIGATAYGWREARGTGVLGRETQARGPPLMTAQLALQNGCGEAAVLRTAGAPCQLPNDYYHLKLDVEMNGM